MEFKSEQHRMAVKAAFIRLASDKSWGVVLTFVEEAIRELETKALAEDDEAKANTYRHDARGARKFWESLQARIEFTKTTDNEPKDDDFLEVIM